MRSLKASRTMSSLLVPLLLLGHACSTALAQEDQYFTFFEPVCQDADKDACLGLVIDEMTARYLPLEAECNHDGLFALLYRAITISLLNSNLPFIEESTIIREDALFADYYFRAYDNYHSGNPDDVPDAWTIVFDASMNKTVTSIGNGLLAVNAHINRDLPLVLYELSERQTPVNRYDHSLINVVLAGADVTDQVLSKWDPDYEQTPKETVESLVDALAWRAKAYNTYRLLQLSKGTRLQSIVEFSIERRARRVGEELLERYRYNPGEDSEARDTFCATAPPVDCC